MLALAILTLLIWLYLFFFHAAFWRIGRFELTTESSSFSGSIAAVVPARDEADTVGQAVSSLLRQDGCGNLQVFLVDDNSSDETANLARSAATMLDQPERLTVIPGSELSPGWTGKLWAMQQGWLAARENNPDYILFTDADIKLGDDSISRLLTLTERGNYDLASLMVKLRCDTPSEKFLIPAFVYFFFLLYPPARVGDARCRIAGAAGGSMIVRAAMLEKLLGLESIRNEIIDDCALARTVKRAGGRIWLGVTQDTRSIRGYGSLTNIRDMIARSAFSQLRHSYVLLVACIIGMALTFVLPAVLLWSANRAAGWIALATCLMMFATYVPILRFYKVNVLSAVTLPFAALFYMYATVVSAWRYWRGKGGQWKGRIQDAVDNPR